MLGKLEIERKLEDAVKDCSFPGAVLGYVLSDGTEQLFAVGHSEYDGGFAVDAASLYDVASLTKVLVTTPLAMLAVDEGRLDLDRPVCEYLPEFSGAEKGRISSRQLLAHCSGLPAWRLYYKEIPFEICREEKLRIVCGTAIEYEPGSKSVYSDIGMMVMGCVLERLFEKKLDELAQMLPYLDYGVRACFCPVSVSRCVPTEILEKGGYCRGIVHDENARWLGGVSGHAGLFADGRALAAYCRLLLNGCEGFCSSGVLDAFIKPADIVQGASRCLGWEAPSSGCAGGKFCSRRSFGHTGFTGTALWVDLEKGRAEFLLGNAVHPRRECKQRSFFRCRNGLADAIFS